MPDSPTYPEYRDDPVGFVRDKLGGHPWRKQREILESVRDHPRTTVRACHGVGKTWTAAGAVLWFFCTRDPCTVLTTAPTWRQVRKLLWREVRKGHRTAGLPGDLLETEIRIGEERQAMGLATNEPERFQGYHDENMLVVVDEASGVNEGIFETIEGALTSEASKVLLIGNPTQTSGTFYRSHHSDPAWNRIHISALMSPNVTGDHEDLEPKDLRRLVTPTWIESRRRDWCGTGPDEGSPVFQIRVLGEFPTSGTDTLIPLAWISRSPPCLPEHLARARARAREARHEGRHVWPLEIGVDVARFGDCENVATVRHGPHVLLQEAWMGLDLMQTTGRIAALIAEWNPDQVKVDAIGLGAGCVDRLHELGHRMVVGVSSGGAPRDTERFKYLRDEMAWGLRERFEAEEITLPPATPATDNRLSAQLSGLKYGFSSAGKIQVESKDDMRRRGLPSPDRADSLVLAFAHVKAKGTAPVTARRKRSA